MSYVHSRTFCCCLPVRLGTFIIAILGLFVGGLVSIGAIIQYKNTWNPDTTTKVAYAIVIIVYGLYAILSILAIVGAAGKKRGLIKAFFGYLTVHVILSIASGAFSLYVYFQSAPDRVNRCINSSSGSFVAVQACKQGMNVAKGVIVTLFILLWLMEIWGCVIVNDYAKQLEEEEMVRRKDAAYLRA
ncbi:hypothetical protein C8J56DRAFT_855185 [Mycena floridula]|nr:hypothetical protein C8J56DRAFT_855185 [Mycena floridula]